MVAWLPPNASTRLAVTVAPAIWEWIEEQLPPLVQRLNLQDMAERKVMAFSTERVEELIRGVIQNELKMIIISGYVLGGVISVLIFGIYRLLGI